MKPWRVVSGEWRAEKNMNIEGKLKSYRELLVWQKSMALCQVAFVGLRVGKPAATGGGFRPVQYRPKDSRVTLLKDPFMPSPGRHQQGGKLFPVPRGCRGCLVVKMALETRRTLPTPGSCEKIQNQRRSGGRGSRRASWGKELAGALLQ